MNQIVSLLVSLYLSLTIFIGSLLAPFKNDDDNWPGGAAA